MANVTKFIIDDQQINITDTEARNKSDSALTKATQLEAKVNEIQQLSRLTVTYEENTSTITFSNKAHTGV